ncbi:Zinc finger, C2H2-type/integrase, DNA-binding protein [Cordyceps fumosorosea ARSEF 2679]|uniref:Zinc finger, C2H2-type/integrase, DNA-binding protein n=1 Tax=Cordyceps fumosorosea (strain ARSEF 2679) TaxID=1081104 RepID=A0A167Q3B8_CORFA|nr:Zinc finger, C2H2-type/integrase, DNA-binding protein [Cordyceps fumosorosea ARSEF 2679]OAA57244.1 Zinc finger, C2H2-type/integrase, DNA-binding protein [Cordyceps fumosorosea ARSEF 2679]
MDRTAPDFSQQTGLPSPYPSNFGGDAHSEASSADQASAPYPPPPKDTAAYPASATPASEYGVYPPPSRSSSAYPDHVQRQYNPASSPSTGSMAQQQQNNPSIAQPSPTYPYGQHSPYAPNPDMAAHSYSHPNSNMYAQPRPEWGGYQHGGAPLTPSHAVYGQTAAAPPPPQRTNQVYSFVPIPGAQQHKRPRRRYEEIERMYKCGWNGCEKAYGTLNHLNAHVTMQSHGQKRTPEEFKEIRKEWKARKKEEESLRKAEEERQRTAAANGGQDGGHDAQASSNYAGSRPQVQLPPIGYQPQYPAPPSGVAQQPLPEYGATGHMYPSYQPHSPYGQPNQNIYGQSNGGQPPNH